MRLSRRRRRCRVPGFARDRVAAHAEEVGRLDPAPAGARQRLGYQRALELARKLIQDAGLAARQAPFNLLLERRKPIRRRCQARVRGLAAKLGGQVGYSDRLPGSHDGKPMAQVLELAHVARKIHPREVGKDVIREALGIDAQFLGAFREEVPGKQRDVLAPFTQ